MEQGIYRTKILSRKRIEELLNYEEHTKDSEGNFTMWNNVQVSIFTKREYSILTIKKPLFRRLHYSLNAILNNSKFVIGNGSTRLRLQDYQAPLRRQIRKRSRKYAYGCYHY